MFKLFHSDCVDLDLKNIRLTYLDPPYCSRKDKYGKGDQYYGVGDTFEEYLDYMKVRLEKLKTFMDPSGSNIVIHVDMKAVHYIKVMADNIFGRENFNNEIIWTFTGPSVSKSHLPRKHNTLLNYGLGKYAFNEEYVPYQGKLKIGGKTAWGGEKAEGTEQVYLDRGKKLEDFWSDIPALCRNEGEKLGWPTQKPLTLMKRIVKMFSNEGDSVYDPFAGSGSLLAAAIELNREAFGSDISDEAVAIATDRLSKFAQK